MSLDTRTIFTFVFVEQIFVNVLSISKGQLSITVKESNSLHSFKMKLKKENYM